MKKIYLQPCMTVEEMELAQLVMASEMPITIDNETSASPEGADVRLILGIDPEGTDVRSILGIGL